MNKRQFENPVAKAVRIAKQRQAAKEFESQILTTRIKMLQAEDGDDATELLSYLAVVLGTPCEAGFRQYEETPPWVRQLHGALRTVQAMCLNGYRWDISSTLAMDRAIEIAKEPREDLEPRLFAEAWVSACKLSDQIMQHAVTAESIASK